MYPLAEAAGAAGELMFNFNNKKSKRIISSVIIILIVLAMVVPSLLYLL